LFVAATSSDSSSTMAAPGGRELPDTPTWAVAVVCMVLVLISVAMEHALHKLTHWFHKRHKKALAEALEKMKAELMLVGFLSLLLTVLQAPISKICISEKAGSVMLPCKVDKAAYAGKGGDGKDNRRRLLSLIQGETHRRFLAGAPAEDVCAAKGQVALMSAGSMHQLHIFIFVLAIFHVVYSVITMALSRLKMRKWKKWEAETASLEYQFSNDPSRFRFTHQTSFVKRHMGLSSITGVRWIVAFFRQFFTSVTKVDYLTLRQGFINAHLSPNTKFDFHKYIKRSLEDDFKVVVGIRFKSFLQTTLFSVQIIYIVCVARFHVMILTPCVFAASRCGSWRSSRSSSISEGPGRSSGSPSSLS